jgi:dimethylamine monooxygenase subunit A
MKYFPLYEEPYKAQLGLKPLDLSEWLERDAEFDRHIDLRRKLIAENRAEVLQILKGNEAACLELYETVAGVVDVPKLANPSAEEALCAIAVSVQEDFVILTAEAPVRAGAALVCFPSRWLLASKIGQDSDGIHQPVPGFQAIAKQTRGFLERIMPDKPMWRTNWTIHDSDELFCPRPHPHRPVADEKIVESTFFRVERQTLRSFLYSNLHYAYERGGRRSE